MTVMKWRGESETYRLATHDDLPKMIEMLGDPEVGRWLWFTPIPPEGVVEYFTPFLDEQTEVVGRGEDPQTVVFTVEDHDGVYLGEGAVVAVEGSPGGSEVGFQLCRDAWGRGVGRRLGRFLTAYAAHRCSAYRLEASCLEGNLGSRRIIEGLGMRLEGTRPGYRLKEGVRHTELFFGELVERLDRRVIDETAREVGLV